MIFTPPDHSCHCTIPYYNAESSCRSIEKAEHAVSVWVCVCMSSQLYCATGDEGPEQSHSAEHAVFGAISAPIAVTDQVPEEQNEKGSKMDTKHHVDATFAPGSARQKSGSYENSVGLCVSGAVHNMYMFGGGPMAFWAALFGLAAVEKTSAFVKHIFWRVRWLSDNGTDHRANGARVSTEKLRPTLN